jgi:linoleoyl-CoA desaturase
MADTPYNVANASPHAGSGLHSLAFADDMAFQNTLHQRVDEYLAATGRRKRDCWQMYVKTMAIFTCFALTYALLVFWAQTWWQGMPLAVLLGLLTAGIGFNIQHDGGHRSYSDRAWVNQLMAWSLDMIGGSSYRWRWKHTVIHHMFVNITGYDEDVDLGLLARVTPHQPHRWHHRWQHLYVWPIYGFLAMKMQLVDDFRFLISGRLGVHRVPRPTRGPLVTFIIGRVIFFAWAFAVPMLFHPVWVVLFYYAVGSLVLGTVLALVFLTPHLVELADFPLPDEKLGRMPTPWAVHQARVTVDFGRGSRFVTWLLGGLNYHKEHHLFPLICHINYPAISKIVEQTSQEFGVPYHAHRSFLTGIAAHYRWLRQMGCEQQAL